MRRCEWFAVEIWEEMLEREDLFKVVQQQKFAVDDAKQRISVLLAG